MTGEREEETPTIPLIVTRIVAATTSLDEFVAQYCRYFGVDVAFLPTESVQPPGRRVRFVFALANDDDVITGEGIVLRMRRDTGDPARPPGMELRYEVLDEASQRVVDRMIAHRTSSTVMRRPEPPPYVSIRVDSDDDDDDDEEETRPGWTAQGASSSGSVPAHEFDISDSTETKPAPKLTLETAAAPRATRPTAVPANPFADVPIHAIEFFVDWALRRATTRGMRRPTRTSFADVDMEAPHRWRVSRYSLGVAGALLLVGFSMALELSYRSSYLAPLGTTARPVAMGTGGNATAVAPTPSPTKTPTVESRVARPGGSAGMLTVTSTPSGSEVYVDGEFRGIAPLTLTVDAGEHQIRAERPRYAAVLARVDGAGRVKLVHERPPAILRVTSTPPGASVELDGDPAGVTPIDLVCPAYENHRVLIELDGHARHRHLYLRPPSGTITVEFPSKSTTSRRVAAFRPRDRSRR